MPDVTASYEMFLDIITFFWEFSRIIDKLSRTMCLNNTHILVCRCALCDCKLCSQVIAFFGISHL